jgi:hypothetical protein
VHSFSSETAEISDYWEWDRLARERDWTDGLPVAPPTLDRVSAIVDYLGRDPADEIGRIAPVYGIATVEQVAIQCAMAGCIPEHVPVVIAALQAMMEPAFNLHGVQCTTNPCSPLTIVSGPIVTELEFNVGNGVFGGGGFANAAIGRAIRLVLWNIGGGKPHVNDMSPLGSPAKYAFCVAENRKQSPWQSFHTDYGLGEEDNAVTVFACSPPYPALATGNAKRMLNTLCEGLASTTINMYHSAGQILVVLSIKPAQELADSGYSKEDVRQYFYEHCALTIGHLKTWGALEGITDSLSTYWGEHGLAKHRPDISNLPDDAKLPMVLRPEDFLIMVAGGDTQWWAGFCVGWGNYGGFAVTKKIVKPGEPA